ncbi:MAG: cyclic nucleotide-binding domain-containing protein [Chlamydiales bacterium]|nr:cyclic nucleotide-binding domain-containing protein [Chlamydiales bacterium]
MKSWTLIDKAFALKTTNLFAELDLDLLLTIADKMGTSRFKEGEIIFPLLQDAHRMYLIVEGTVQIQDTNEHILAHLHQGDFFGDESLFNEKPRAYSAHSLTHTTLLTLSKIHLLTIISECPSVATTLLHAYTSYIGFRPRQ